MESDENNGNLSDKAVGAQSAPAEMNSAQVQDTARQLQATVSRFAQEAQGNQESVIALMRQVSGQQRTTDPNARKSQGQIADEEAMGAQTASAEINSDKVHGAAQQLQASVSRFAQEAQRESFVTLIKQVSEQLRTTDAKVQDNRAQIDKLASRIKNYRS